jgi:hypothetical protein
MTEQADLLKILDAIKALALANNSFSHSLSALSQLFVEGDARLTGVSTANLLLVQLLLKRLGIPPAEFAEEIRQHIHDAPGLEHTNAELRLHVEACAIADQAAREAGGHGKSTHRLPAWCQGVIQGGRGRVEESAGE